jgi:hypothetical protein
MKIKYWFTIFSILILFTGCMGRIAKLSGTGLNIDADSNDAVDVGYGGTNVTTLTAFLKALAGDVLTSAPASPANGQFAISDGDNWQPGSTDQGTHDWLCIYRSSDTTWVGVYDITSGSFVASNVVITDNLGTGVETALGVNVGSAGAVVVNGGALGTPSGGILTNCTFPTIPIASGGTGQTSAANAFNALKQSATTSATGVSELATTAETTTGTDTSRVVTPDGLSGSIYGQKEIGWTVYDSDVDTAVADGKQSAIIPASMNGMNLIDVTCSVSSITGATSGTTTVVLRRVRSATAVDMTSTGVTIDYNAYTASDETVNTSNDDVATGDKIYVDVNAVTAGAAQKGLSCTAVFQTP